MEESNIEKPSVYNFDLTEESNKNNTEEIVMQVERFIRGE